MKELYLNKKKLHSQEKILIYSGIYRFFHNKKQYSIEVFEIYEALDRNYIYQSQVINVLPDGSLLKFVSKYLCTSEGVPLAVETEKFIKNIKIKENYTISGGTVFYSFESGKDIKECKINYNDILYIGVYSFAVTFCFTQWLIQSKKKVNAQILRSPNNLNYVGPPTSSAVFVINDKPQREIFRIKGEKINAHNILIYSATGDEEQNLQNPIKLLTKHGPSLPIRATLGNNVVIELGNLKTISN